MHILVHFMSSSNKITVFICLCYFVVVEWKTHRKCSTKCMIFRIAMKLNIRDSFGIYFMVFFVVVVDLLVCERVCVWCFDKNVVLVQVHFRNWLIFYKKFMEFDVYIFWSSQFHDFCCCIGDIRKTCDNFTMTKMVAEQSFRSYGYCMVTIDELSLPQNRKRKDSDWWTHACIHKLTRTHTQTLSFVR